MVAFTGGEACRDPSVWTLEEPVGHLHPLDPIFDRGEGIDEPLNRIVALDEQLEIIRAGEPVALESVTLVVHDQASAVGQLNDQVEHSCDKRLGWVERKGKWVLASRTASRGKSTSRLGHEGAGEQRDDLLALLSANAGTDRPSDTCDVLARGRAGTREVD